MLKKVFCIIMVSQIAGSCMLYKRKKKDDILEEEKKVSPPSGQVVMIIDTDIDPNHPLYKDRVLGAYTISCEESEGLIEDEIQKDITKYKFDELKQKVLKQLNELIDSGKSGDNCRVVEGINFKPLNINYKNLYIEKKFDV